MVKTERDVQDIIHSYYVGRLYEAPNIYLYNWESDFISVTRSGFVHEYEIKLTVADFMNESKNKKFKHQVLTTGCRALRGYERKYMSAPDSGYWLRLKLNEMGKVIERRPNYFWYVCPEGMLKRVPLYAGLIHLTKYGMKVVRKASLLHKEKIPPDIERKMLVSLYHRYWQLRTERRKQ